MKWAFNVVEQVIPLLEFASQELFLAEETRHISIAACPAGNES
jgi:hypothetical protein